MDRTASNQLLRWTTLILLRSAMGWLVMHASGRIVSIVKKFRKFQTFAPHRSFRLYPNNGRPILGFVLRDGITR
ncbi:hypothetical protein QTP88_028235 [Uroleucon formosanum]